MSLSNRERVGKALDLLRDGLAPFVKREMEAIYGASWSQEALKALRKDSDWVDRGDDLALDSHGLLVIMWNQWNEVFKQVLGFAERSLVSELREVRNRWAHQQPFSSDDAYRALDSISRLLSAVSARETREVDAMKQELLRIKFDEQARRQARQASFLPTEGQPMAGLKPWREIVTPHRDVASGRYQQAEFVADLAQVHRGEGTSEYRDPREFYQRTFLTEGLRRLLVNALMRLSGEGGDPVVELQTNFGGGKTHSMLALYHLFSDTPAAELLGVDGLLVEANVNKPASVRRAVLVGTALSPGQRLRSIPGGQVNTLWGELAWQLGGPEGFALVREADAQGVSPGSDALRDLFTRFGPCLVLIDEWIAFVRQLYHTGGSLPAGSFEANMTFAQAVTEAARQVSNTLLVASIPASDVEIGGEGGREALQRIRNTFGRMELSWRPASADEGFEIVRRRLFEPITEPHKFVARDAVVEAFGRLYREQSQEFPSGCREGDYIRRLKMAYPIHPELFDRLYGAWSTVDKFQRTRGVLRLMATVIHALWERNDSGLMIMPGMIPVDDPAVHSELTKYLDDNWQSVIDKDVDGPHSLPLALDRDNPNQGRYSASRRVARTIYMGSAPISRAPNPGIDERSVKLGCVQPGENPAIFGDALRRLTDHATHLYVDGSRYWFSTQPSVTRLAQDRAEALSRDDILQEVRNRLRRYGSKGDFAGVHPVPENSSEVVDEAVARLVIIDPEHTHVAKSLHTPALLEAESILKNRGQSPRIYRNMLVFLAPDHSRLAELESAVAQYLAWSSILDDQERLDLNATQRRQAETKRDDAEKTVSFRLGETYCWLLVPMQPDPKGDIEWEESRLQGAEPLAERASKRLRGTGLISTYSATSLRIELDRFLWKDIPHISLKTLWEYMASYNYLPRLRDQDVLIRAVQDGIFQVTWSENFAYAEAYDESRNRYLGLRAGQSSSVVLDGRSVLVKPEVALEQMRSDGEAQEPGGEGPAKPGPKPPPGPGPVGGGEGPRHPREPIVRRFYGVATIDPLRMSRDVGTIANEIVQHFTRLTGANVEVTVEISVTMPAGIPEQVVRTVGENCRTLKFRTQEFEKE